MREHSVIPPPLLMGGMRVSQNGLGWGGCEILRNNGGDAKKGGDDLRIGGMALLNDNFL